MCCVLQAGWRSSKCPRPWSWWRRCGRPTWGWWRRPSRSSGKTSRSGTRRTSSACTRREAWRQRPAAHHSPARPLAARRSALSFYFSFVKSCTYLCLTSKYRSVYYCNTKFSLERVRTDDRLFLCIKKVSTPFDWSNVYNEILCVNLKLCRSDVMSAVRDWILNFMSLL